MSPEVCSTCRLWVLGADDGFCGFCSRPIIPCDIDIKKLVLITNVQNKKSLTVTNQGAADLEIEMSADIGDNICITFAPPAQTVKAGQSGLTVISIDPESMEYQRSVVTGHVVCRLGGKNQRSLKVPLTVKSGPRPQVSPEFVDFSDVVAGSSRQLQINVRNLGGVPLGIFQVLCEGLPPDFFEVRHPDGICLPDTKLSVEPGATLPLTVAVHRIPKSIAQKQFDGAVLVHFSNYKNPPTLRIPVLARIFSCSCSIDPSELKIDPCPAGGTSTLRFKLVNDGSSELKIQAVETDQKWLFVSGGENSFELLPSVPGEPRQEVSEGQFLYEREIELQVDASALPLGEQSGNILVRVNSAAEPFSFPVTVNVIEPQEYHEYIGIDFGTTNSVVAINDAKRGLFLIKVQNPVSELTELIPSVLVFKGSLESSVFGYEALNAANIYPENSVRSIKRIMGCERPRTYFGQQLTPSVLAGMILRKLVDLAELTFYRETEQYCRFKRVIITVPANFYGIQVKDILTACSNAGLETGGQPTALGQEPAAGLGADIVLKEPTAGAIYCMYHLRGEPQFRDRLLSGKPMHLLIFDYGGGTVDVSLVGVQRPEGNGIELTCLATSGNNKIGGEGMTLSLMKELLRKCAAANPVLDESLIREQHSALEARKRTEGWSAMSWGAILAARSTWKELAEKVKIILSSVDRTTVRVPAEAILSLMDRGIRTAQEDYTCSFDREEFELLIGGFLDQSKKLITDVIAKASVKASAKAGDTAEDLVVDYVLHTGRASLMPAVYHAAQEALPGLTDDQNIRRAELLKSCVARGAALYGTIRQGPGAGIRINTQASTLPFSFGYRRFELLDWVFEPIIPMDSACSVREERRFGPGEFSNGKLKLTFYRNSGTNRFIDGNPEAQPIGETTVNQDNGGAGCVVAMTVDANGILTVEVDSSVVPISEVREEDDSWDA